MGITESTVRAHIAHAYSKLEVSSVVDAMRVLGLLS
jgi:DNA-binding CsgD family transcriptional regulator